MSYAIEPLLLTNRAEDKTPDIVGSGKSGWLIVEITLNSGSKEPNLQSYSSIDPRFLAQHGLDIHETPPDVISSRLSFVDDGPHCQLIVRDRLLVMKEDRINNKLLKSALIASRGVDLTRLPNLPITLLPEMRANEIRIGLIDIVMQLFKPGSEGKNLKQFMDEGLERLSDSVSNYSKRILRDKIKTEMNALVKDVLKGYLVFDEAKGVYKSTEKFKQHPKTMERIALALRDWAGIGPQKTLDLFPR